MHINVHLRQTIYETPSRHTHRNRRQCKAALEMTNEHLPLLQLLQVHLINIGMECGVAEVLYRAILVSLPTVWQSLSALLMFHCLTTTVKQAVVSYKKGIS